MSALASFHWGWLCGAALLGLIVGWIAVVRRSPGLSVQAMRWLLVVIFVLVAVAVAQLLPGRFGYWLDLGLVMGACYLTGCVVGSLLRDWVVTRAVSRAVKPDA